MKPKRILVIDDDIDVLRTTSRTLEDAGYEVQRAQSGREGLKHIWHAPPDLVVLDVVMPELNGWDVLQAIRGDDATAKLPVVMLTVLDEDQHVAQGWQLGADFYLTKPFSPAHLLDVVKRLLLATEQADEPDQSG
ncbi:MAG: response regulator [Armatimonadota bacterium]